MEQDFRLFDWEGNLLCNVNHWKSLDWQLLFNDVGTFEGHFAPESKVGPVVFTHPYLIAVHGDRQAIITGYQAGEELAVYGRQLNWILTRNTAEPFEELTATAEAHARRMVQAGMAHAACFELGAEAGYTAEVPYTLDKYTQLFKAVQEVLELDGGGHRVSFDVKTARWKFEAVRGTVRQKLLSSAYNAYQFAVSYDMLSYYNAGWYEQEPPHPAEGEEKGDPVWTHIGGDQTGIYQFNTVLSGKTLSEAETDLAKNAIQKQYSALVRNLTFGEDYALGDTLRIQFVLGQFRETIERKVAGVNLSYSTEFEQEPILTE